jgi:hypothetical protein
MAEGTKYPCTMRHHVVYLGPWSNIAQNVLERVTECVKHNKHKTSVILFLFIFYTFENIFVTVIFSLKKGMPYHTYKITD